MTSPSSRRAHVVGLGLIGGSVALALRDAGWRVTGEDRDPQAVATARQRGVVDDGGLDVDVDLVVVATPAGSVVEVVDRVLSVLTRSDAIVTDVAGVKSHIVESIRDPRFLGGHPMAGSEQRGVAASRGDLFRECTWVLTPTATTPPELYTALHGVWREVGARVLAISADDHDRLVAMASHVPHLLAGALMNEVAVAAQTDAVLLQLAAGGFRDMTRVAAGDPTIWPDILVENREAITRALDGVLTRLRALRSAVGDADRSRLTDALTSAARARRALPGRALHTEDLGYIRVGLADRPGQLATVTTVASDLAVNIFDIEIAHDIEGLAGTLLLAVDAAGLDLLAVALAERGFTVSRER